MYANIDVVDVLIFIKICIGMVVNVVLKHYKEDEL